MSDEERETPHLRGVVFIHSCPNALMSHVEWALANIVGPGARLEWIDQPVLPGTHRSELGFRALPGTASRIASELRAFPGLRYEVTQEPAGSIEGERYAVTPSLGIFRAATGPFGDIMVSEERLRGALARSTDSNNLSEEINKLLGTAWDEELEAFRYAGEGASIRWMHEVG